MLEEHHVHIVIKRGTNDILKFHETGFLWGQLRQELIYDRGPWSPDEIKGVHSRGGGYNALLYSFTI